MKASVFKRFLCVALVFVFMFTFSISASAAKWLMRNANYAPFITWSYYNLPVTHRQLQLALSDGQNYWLSGVTRPPTFAYNSNALSILGTDGSIIHTVTSETDWLSLCYDDSTKASSVYAVSKVVITTGAVITNFADPGFISYSIIYYSPRVTTINPLTSTDLRCLVAHEVGHCMGLNHTDGAAVMKDLYLGATGLNDVDKSIYNDNYDGT